MGIGKPMVNYCKTNFHNFFFPRQVIAFSLAETIDIVYRIWWVFLFVKKEPVVNVIYYTNNFTISDNSLGIQ